MKKKLTKSNTDIMLTGTLAGIAEYFDIDPTIVRVVYVIVTVGIFGFPILLYIALAIIIPRVPRSGTDYENQQQNDYGQQNHYYQSENSNNTRKDVTNSDDE